MCLCVLSVIVTPDQMKLSLETGNADELRFAACRAMDGDGSCTSPGAGACHRSQGQRAGPVSTGPWLLEGKVICGPPRGRAAGSRHPLVTPSSPQGLTPGAANCLLAISLRNPNLYSYLKLPISFSALF